VHHSILSHLTSALGQKHALPQRSVAVRFTPISRHTVAGKLKTNSSGTAHEKWSSVAQEAAYDRRVCLARGYAACAIVVRLRHTRIGVIEQSAGEVWGIAPVCCRR
jgi:hypothetical protein